MQSSRFSYTGLKFSQTCNIPLDLQVHLQLFYYFKFIFYFHIFFICTWQANMWKFISDELEKNWKETTFPLRDKIPQFENRIPVKIWSSV
jgi:hypothetical protein